MYLLRVGLLIVAVAAGAGSASSGGGAPAAAPSSYQWRNDPNIQLGPTLTPDQHECRANHGEDTLRGIQSYAIQTLGWSWVKRLSVPYTSGMLYRTTLTLDPAMTYEMNVMTEAGSQIALRVYGPDGNQVANGDTVSHITQVAFHSTSATQEYTFEMGYTNPAFPTMCVYMSVLHRPK